MSTILTVGERFSPSNRGAGDEHTPAGRVSNPLRKKSAIEFAMQPECQMLLVQV